MTRPAAGLPLVAALVLVLLASPAPATALPGTATAAAPAAAERVVLGGVRVRVGPRTRQVVTVNHTHGHHARVAFWTRTGERWVRRMVTTDGRTGYGGLVRGGRRRQGTGTTPLGTYALPWAFGTHRAEDGWDLRYRRIRRGDFWVQDNASDFYNRYRHQSRGGFRWWLPSSHPDVSERLTDYGRQYEYAVVVGFNPGQVRHRGSGIFLHVNGRGATAGCVSAPRGFLRRLLRRLDPDLHPVIAVGR
ncbi:L,D-transpeptidase family protein [Nocardioides sp. 503]|uniref:L,D-transpeptidase family protein n=1 Tax=Nocardioides sp. 503 TaxID=2508326 RepID=UPI001FD6C95E|nr:L,D-transpeptidase family protein [Nocardioides sp. 503]